MPVVTVIIPTYNPNPNFIDRVLNALKVQTLDKSLWELIIVDNNSTNDLLKQTNLSWHPNGKIIKELNQGLTYSRIRGFNMSQGDIIIMVDDDNILSPDYLQTTIDLFEQNNNIGSAGGIICGIFDNYQPAQWTKQFWNILAIRDFENTKLISESALLTSYPAFAPVGAGMAIRRQLLNTYIKTITENQNIITDRIGDTLSSGGDNEINIHVLMQGYAVAYHPQLTLQHIIPPQRLTKTYLARLNYSSSHSWIKLLLKYNICPWKPIAAWTVPWRKIKAWINYKAWSSPANYIKWRGACGVFESLAKLK